MAADEVLFGAVPRTRGRIRRGLDDDIAAEQHSGRAVPAGQKAHLRALADRLDSLDRILGAATKPFDFVPMAQLSREYREARAEAMPHRAVDPMDLLMEGIASVGTGVGDAPQP